MATQLVNDAIELLHDQSLPTIELLQKSFPSNQNLMINISTLFDPRYVFLVYAPLLFALNRRIGHRLVIALTLCEWINQLLKWLLVGERPYWYVYERAEELAVRANKTTENTEHLLMQRTPELKQFTATCELGAGSPSGHAMVTATVWYVLIEAYLAGELGSITSNNRQQPESAKKSSLQLAKLGWSIYSVMLIAVSLSRVYLACHFPHQCVCGAILGLLLARFVSRQLPIDKLRPNHFKIATLVMLVSALGTFGLLQTLGWNPMRSVDKGMRWCANKEHIHLDTTPFFSMMRYLGFCLGAGLAYEPKRQAARQQVIGRLLAAFTALSLGQLLMILLPFANLNQFAFYLISFAAYAFFSYSIAGPIPRLSELILSAHLTHTKYTTAITTKKTTTTTTTTRSYSKNCKQQ